MEENRENVEIFEEDSIITLFDDEENPVDFNEIASIELDGKFYELLQPVGTIEGIGEDEAVILEYVIDDESDRKVFKPMFDETLLNRVFEQYLRAVSDLDADCGCGDEDCEHHHCGCGCEGEEEQDEESCGGNCVCCHGK